MIGQAGTFQAPKAKEGFNCTTCGKRHEFGAYVFAHWDMSLSHTCDCGARHSIKQGNAIPLKKDELQSVRSTAKEGE